MLVTIVILNNLGVKVFGHIEFWMSFMKIVILIGLLLFSLIIDLGGGPTGDRIGFRHWTNGQAFKEYKEDGPLGRFIGECDQQIPSLSTATGGGTSRHLTPSPLPLSRLCPCHFDYYLS